MIRIKKHELRIMVFTVLSIILNSLFAVHPVYAEVNIGKTFGFGSITSLGQLTSQIVNPLFAFAGALVVIFFLWGAFKYLISGGNKEEVAAARGMITHAIIGFIILMFAFVILQFLLFSLFGITSFQLFRS